MRGNMVENVVKKHIDPRIDPASPTLAICEPQGHNRRRRSFARARDLPRQNTYFTTGMCLFRLLLLAFDVYVYFSMLVDFVGIERVLLWYAFMFALRPLVLPRSHVCCNRPDPLG